MKQKLTVELDAIHPDTYYSGQGLTNAEVIKTGLNLLVQQCHAASYNRGWWHDPITGMSLIPGAPDVDYDASAADYDFALEQIQKAWFPYVIATKIALIHSEVSEGLEAYRVDATDDKINFPGITAEMGDAVIRIADLIGCLQWYHMNYPALNDTGARVDAYDLGAAILAKLPVNAGRPDHDLAKRKEPGGKKF